MKRITIIIALCLVALIQFGFKNKERKPIDSAQKRAELLLSKMTLSEKVAQLKVGSFEAIKAYTNQQGEVNRDSLKKYFPHGISGMNIDINLDPSIYVNVANSIQRYNLSTRCAIPAMFVGEGLHGYMSNGATVFPQAIALGCSWDPEMLERIYRATALEASSRGVKQMLSPVLDLAREPRFGRTEEMYSEDAYLVAICGQAAVWGFQGRNGQPDQNHVAATLKHFMGHGQPEGGRNVAPIDISKYELVNHHLLPFEKAIQAGALSVMPSYNEIGGVPNHGNHWMLRDLLRGELGFSGLITADQSAIEEMYKTHSVVPTLADAAKLAIESGVDLDLRYIPGAYDELEALVKAGKLKEKQIDESVRRVLFLKFKLGIFEQQIVDVNQMKAVTHCQAHQDLALEAAQKSLVLLKNNNQTLPFNIQTIKKIAVVGPLAKGVHFGGYTAEPRHGVDLLEGIQQLVQNQVQVIYAEGCKIAKEESSFWRDPVHTPNDEAADQILINEAVKVAEQSDVVVLALGETVAFSREAWGENHLGDRDDLNLLGRQNQLVEALSKTGKPIVVLMFGGRPLSFNLVNEKVPAIIQVFYPGEAGGTAMANVLFGKVNPSGKLSITIPKSVGQLPCYYSRQPSRMRSYIYYLGSEPLYPFGYGLSYTQYSYSNLTISHSSISKTDSVEVSVQVTNQGKMAGEEVVQLYIHDVVSSGVRPILELKDFTRVSLQPQETKKVTFMITPDKLAYYNPQLQKVVEPGLFNIGVGPNSVSLKQIKLNIK